MSIPMRAMYAKVRLQEGPKIYGRVRYRSRVGYRKYAHEIPGGLSFLAVMIEMDAAKRIRNQVEPETPAG